MKGLRRNAVIMLRLIFGAILIYAGAVKAGSSQEFAFAIENYRVLNLNLSAWVAVWLPSLELLTGILLISGFWPKSISIVNVIIMFIFFCMILQAYIRNLDIVCGCFSASSGTVNFTKLLENGLLLAGGVILTRLVFSGKPKIKKSAT